MRSARKRALMALVTLVAFAAAPVPSFAAEQVSDRSAGPADRKGQVQGQEALAEYYLSRLAQKSRRARTTGGGISLALGTLSLVGGISTLGEEDDWLELNKLFGTILILEGGLLCAGGTIALAFPSAAEKSYQRVRDLADPGEREVSCADALARLARNARRSRMIMSGLFCATGVAVATASGGERSSGPLLSAALAGGMALSSFLIKSSAERTYQAYLERSRIKAAPDLILGFGPGGSFRAGLSLAF